MLDAYIINIYGLWDQLIIFISLAILVAIDDAIVDVVILLFVIDIADMAIALVFVIIACVGYYAVTEYNSLFRGVNPNTLL
jgi:hypothetical protein